MISYRNELVRLLVEICVMLLKAKRHEIERKELDEVCKKHYDIIGASEMLLERDFVNEIRSTDSEWDNKAQRWVTKGWDIEKKQWKKIKVRYPLKVYESIIKKIDNKELPYIPEELLRGDFRDYPIRGKVIWGIGERAIALVPKVEYHEECAHPRTAVGKKQFINYKKNKLEAERIAKEILEQYGK